MPLLFCFRPACKQQKDYSTARLRMTKLFLNWLKYKHQGQLPPMWFRLRMKQRIPIDELVCYLSSKLFLNLSRCISAR